MINSDKFITKLRALGVVEADIKDLFNYRYHIDYNKILMGQLFMMPNKADDDLEIIARNFPIAYLIGFVNFYGLKINVNPNVLIPRPETEELMEIINKRQKNTLINTALDLCTGSGCIALSLKKMFPKATIYASDISYKALMVGQVNAEENKLEINLALSNFLDYFVKHQMKFDLIVSNPPYIKEGELLDASLEYEPKEALYSGQDGLNAFYSIFSNLDKVLNPHGVAYFEFEASNKEATLILARELLKAYEIEVIKDMENKDRFLFVKRRKI